MGGFTEIHLKNTSEENIKEQNRKLKSFGVPAKYRFYSETDIKKEYKCFIKGEGAFPEHLFPKNEINSYEDFKKYWNPSAIGSTFCPYAGSLTFDCYFGRTSDKDMRGIANYLLQNHNEIKSADGSFDTFMSKVMTDEEIERIKGSEILID